MSIDGNPYDMATFVIALLSSLIRPARRASEHSNACFDYHHMLVDFLNGIVIVPFLLLIGAVFSNAILEEALRSNKLFLGVGGVIGLSFVLRDYFSDD